MTSRYLTAFRNADRKPKGGSDLLLTSNLVSHSLGLDDGDIIDDSLVDVEILGKFSVVLLNDSSGGSLDGLGSDSTHFLEKKMCSIK